MRIRGCCSGGNVNGHDRMCRKSLPKPSAKPLFCAACGDADITEFRSRYSAVIAIGHARGTDPGTGTPSHKARNAVRWSGAVCHSCKDALVEDIALAFAHRLQRLRGTSGLSCPAVGHTGDCARDDCVGSACKAIEDCAYEIGVRPATVRVHDGDDLLKYTLPEEIPATVPPARTYSSGRPAGLFARIYAYFRTPRD